MVAIACVMVVTSDERLERLLAAVTRLLQLGFRTVLSSRDAGPVADETARQLVTAVTLGGVEGEHDVWLTAMSVVLGSTDPRLHAAPLPTCAGHLAEAATRILTAPDPERVRDAACARYVAEALGRAA